MGSGRSKAQSKIPSKPSKNRSARRQANGNSEDRARTVGEAGRSETRDGAGFYLAVFFGFFVAALIAYAPALDGAFISDDEHYVLNNAFVHEATGDNVLAIMDPRGTPAKLVENYAPVHLFLYMLEWQGFERETFGYHVVNIAFHALASLLLFLVFRGCAIPRTPALLGSTFFLLHPANVEAVAWISQQKTPSALVLSLLALILHRRRPAAGALLFALALFAKPTAAVALFVLAGAAFQARRGVGEAGRDDARSWHWGWIGAWAVALVAFAFAEFWAFNQTAGQAPVLYPDPIVRLRTVFAVALRYVVMSLSSYGLSVFQEPPPAQSWFDPWWLGSLVVLAGLGWRTLATFVAGRREALFWIWAAVSFAPICGIIPLPFPMADRYLYFILPGLIGGVLLAARDHLPALVERLAPARSPVTSNRFLAGAAIVWIALFAVRVHQRATIWHTGYSMMADAEAHYPEGMAAQTRIARRLALAGDAEGAVRALRAARARGYNRLDHLLNEHGYDGIRNDPRFVELMDELAREWIDRYEKIEEPDQHEYRVMAQAYVVLGDIDRAIECIRSGIATPGPITKDLEEDLEGLLRIKRIRQSRLPESLRNDP